MVLRSGVLRTVSVTAWRRRTAGGAAVVSTRGGRSAVAPRGNASAVLPARGLVMPEPSPCRAWSPALPANVPCPWCPRRDRRQARPRPALPTAHDRSVPAPHPDTSWPAIGQVPLGCLSAYRPIARAAITRAYRQGPAAARAAGRTPSHQGDVLRLPPPSCPHQGHEVPGQRRVSRDPVLRRSCGHVAGRWEPGGCQGIPAVLAGRAAVGP